jgi:hypothetical protein
MDNTSIVTLIIVILIGLILIILNRVSQSKNKNTILSELFTFAKENNCSITDYDHWKNAKIGFDKKSGILLFIRTNKEKKINTVVNLIDVIKCQGNKTNHTASSGKDKVSVIDKLGLVFFFKDINKTNLYLEFYNTEFDNLNLNGELQLMEKWAGIVQQFITKQ